MPGVTLIPKDFFFDRQVVKDAVDRGKLRALSKAGAYVRQTAKTSMRPASKSQPNAAPGKPPKTHTRKLRDLIFFAYANGAVDVGPTPYGDGTAPEVLEHGGDEVITDHGKRRTAHFRGNPFMAPALAAEIQKGTIASAWAGAVR